MKQKAYVTTLILFLFVCSVNAQTFLIDDFDSYADTAALQSEWSSFGNASNDLPILATGTGIGGTNAIQYDLNWAEGNNGNLLYSLDTNDLSAFTDISFSAYIDAALADNPLVKLAIEGGANDSIWQTSSSAALAVSIGSFSELSFSLFDNMELVVNNSDTLNETISNVTSIRLRFENNSLSGLQSVFVDNLTAVPEPSSIAAMLGLGALGLAFFRRRRQTNGKL